VRSESTAAIIIKLNRPPGRARALAVPYECYKEWALASGSVCPWLQALKRVLKAKDLIAALKRLRHPKSEFYPQSLKLVPFPRSHFTSYVSVNEPKYFGSLNLKLENETSGTTAKAD
jgi:hypothetical protein